MNRISISIITAVMLAGFTTIFTACENANYSQPDGFEATVEARVTEELARAATSTPDLSLIIASEVEKALSKRNLKTAPREVQPLAFLIPPTSPPPDADPIQGAENSKSDSQTPTPPATIIVQEPAATTSLPVEEPILTPAMPDPTSVPTSSHYFERGKSYYRQKLYQSAIIEFTMVIDLSPNFRDGYWLRGDSFSHLKEYQLAIEDYRKAFEIDSKNTDLLVDYGQALTEIGEYDQAIYYYNKATSLKPTEPHAFHYRAITLSKLSKFKESNTDYARACALSTQYCTTLTDLNICSEEDIKAPHTIWGSATGAHVSAWVDDIKLLEVMPGGVTKINAPYSMTLSVCEKDYWSLIGKTVKFKIEREWTLQSTILLSNKTEKINLSIPSN